MNTSKVVFLRIGLLVIVIVMATLVFSSLAEDLVNRESLSTFDPIFGGWLIAHTSLTGDYLFSTFTFLGNALVISTGTALLGFWYAKQKLWDRLTFLFSAIGGDAALNLMLKNIFQRSRPVFPHAFLIDTGYSFPSGHAMISIVFYGAITFLLWDVIRKRSNKVLLVIGFFLITALIGFSRLYLGVHFLTDILAGWAAGGLWLAVCILGFFWFHRSRSQNGEVTLKKSSD